MNNNNNNNNKECSIRISSMLLQPSQTHSPNQASASAATKSPTNKVAIICSKVGARTITEVSLILRPIRSSLVFNKTGFNLVFPIWSRVIFKATINTAFSHNSQKYSFWVYRCVEVSRSMMLCLRASSSTGKKWYVPHTWLLGLATCSRNASKISSSRGPIRFKNY